MARRYGRENHGHRIFGVGCDRQFVRFVGVVGTVMAGDDVQFKLAQLRNR